MREPVTLVFVAEGREASYRADLEPSQFHVVKADPRQGTVSGMFPLDRPWQIVVQDQAGRVLSTFHSSERVETVNMKTFHRQDGSISLIISEGRVVFDYSEFRPHKSKLIPVTSTD